MLFDVCSERIVRRKPTSLVFDFVQFLGVFVRVPVIVAVPNEFNEHAPKRQRGRHFRFECFV
jgi:hypothetical protein